MCAHALVLCVKGLDLSKMDPYVGAHELGHPCSTISIPV